ncbi:uncharacterized protein PG986_010212 [Apiospora aurea]|uniref:Uncharacterized protein n=1 Tax=Apiospora aurea TaxID=335848 RepID=A0ABR1Q9U5_9PEZI
MATHYALLIGNCFCPVANSENWGPPLRGCVRDVLKIKAQLARSPLGVDIKVLAAGPADATNPGYPGEVEEAELPTHSNVLSSIEGITARASAGNFVYIHFSGHSTAITPDSGSPSSNGSTGDLALAVLASDDVAEIQYLRGLELAYQLKAMVDKGLKVTLVLDCCVSGSAVRDKPDPLIRYLPYDRDVDLARPPLPGKSLGPSDGSAQPSDRDSSLRPNWLVDPDGYTILTACGPREIARELKVGDECYGVLSYFLIRAFVKYGRVGGWQHHIYSHLRARFREEWPEQNPMLYGSMGLWFFGDAYAAAEAASIPVVRRKGRRGLDQAPFQLEAGEAHGICKGDRFSLHGIIGAEEATSSMFSSSEDNHVVVEVTEVRALTSDLGDATQATRDLGSGLTATAITHLDLRRFPIKLDLRLPRSDVWIDALKQRPSLKIDSQMFDQTSFSFYATVNKEGYEIYDHSHQPIPGLPSSPYSPEENADYILDIMEHLTKFRAVEVLANQALKLPVDTFTKSLDIQVVDSDGTAHCPGCRHDGAMATGCSHEECIVTVRHGEKLRLEVRNKESPGGRDLYVHLYNMAHYSWSITNSYHGDYHPLPPRFSNRDADDYRSGTTGEWKPVLQMLIPDELLAMGHDRCEDTIKVLVTSAPTSFMCFELPKLADVARPSGKKSKFRGGSGEMSEDWVALNFRVRTQM